MLGCARIGAQCGAAMRKVRQFSLGDRECVWIRRVFVRTQSTIRADGTPSAQALNSAITQAPAVRNVE